MLTFHLISEKQIKIFDTVKQIIFTEMQIVGWTLTNKIIDFLEFDWLFWINDRRNDGDT